MINKLLTVIIAAISTFCIGTGVVTAEPIKTNWEVKDNCLAVLYSEDGSGWVTKPKSKENRKIMKKISSGLFQGWKIPETEENNELFYDLLASFDMNYDYEEHHGHDKHGGHKGKGHDKHGNKSGVVASFKEYLTLYKSLNKNIDGNYLVSCGDKKSGHDAYFFNDSFYLIDSDGNAIYEDILTVPAPPGLALLIIGVFGMFIKRKKSNSITIHGNG